MPEWEVKGYCDEATSTCLHGDYDESCRVIIDNQRYEGMEDTEDGRTTFCRFAAGIPVKAVECPESGAKIVDDSVGHRSNGIIARRHGFFGALGFLLLLFAC